MKCDPVLFRFSTGRCIPEDIRHQSRKLSKIAPNFGLFLPSQIL